MMGIGLLETSGQAPRYIHAVSAQPGAARTSTSRLDLRVTPAAESSMYGMIQPTDTLAAPSFQWSGICAKKSAAVSPDGMSVSWECPIQCKNGRCEELAFQSVIYRVGTLLNDVNYLQMVAIEVLATFGGECCQPKKCRIKVRACQVKWGIPTVPGGAIYVGPDGKVHRGPTGRRDIPPGLVPAILEHGCSSNTLPSRTPNRPTF